MGCHIEAIDVSDVALPRMAHARRVPHEIATYGDVKQVSCHPCHLLGFQQCRRNPVAHFGTILVCAHLKGPCRFAFIL
jgi:hypothetical protein